MPLKFFGKKCLQRRNSDVLCKRVTLATPSISSLRVTLLLALQLFQCSVQVSQLGTSTRKDLSEQSSGSSRRQEVPSFVQTPCSDSLSTAHVETSLAPGCTLTTKFSVRRAQDTNSLAAFFRGGGSPRPFVSTKVGLARAGFVAAATAAPTVCARVKAWTRPCC